jgi:NAD(P)-dependent dehydrogenase (short-subunit alcohol dehydrogenase family)
MPDVKRMEGKIVAVTGASSGIGRGLAERFAAEGAAVVIGARSKAKLDQVAAGIKAKGGKALAVALDVRREEDIVAFVAQAVATFGRLDVFVNNAGVGVWKRIEETSLAELHAVMRTNLYGTFLGCREAFRQMRAQGGGTILNISSMAGKDAWEGTGVYSASKFGIQGLSRALADEGRAHDIRVSCICPGMVDTPLITGDDVGARDQLIRVADVAEAAVYLATLAPNIIVPELLLERKLAE